VARPADLDANVCYTAMPEDTEPASKHRRADFLRHRGPVRLTGRRLPHPCGEIRGRLYFRRP
jgi:hypothetical protein